jgi:transcriptional regulator with PAS, ATPase and Fis domain
LIICFKDVNAGVVGRGESTRVAIGAAGLELSIRDSWMSVKHARFERKMAGWTLYDDDSKNGCWVNGDPVHSVLLRDKDVVEVGSTFLVFRERMSEQASTALGWNPPTRSISATACPELLDSLCELRQVAESSLPILILGETGTGKELTARAVHDFSGRKGPFCAVNCAAIPMALAEAELFGYKKGAFTGAVEDRIGLIRSADGGTLFLDEVGELDLPIQAKLLRALQEREVLPVGATRPIQRLSVTWNVEAAV